MKKIFIVSLIVSLTFLNAQITITKDTSFGNNGVVTLNLQSPILISYKITSNKKLITSYEEGIDTPYGSFLRTNIEKLDENGMITETYTSSPNNITPVSYYNGNKYQTINNNSIISCYNPNHSLEITFGNNGQLDMNGYSLPHYFENGSILFVDALGNFQKYLPTGQIDNSFGNNGIVATSNILSTNEDVLFNNYFYNHFNPFYYTVASTMGYRKIDINTGNLDVSYGNNGTSIISNVPAYIRRDLFLPNGEIMTLYKTDINSNQYYLSKTLADGQLDQSFGNNNGYVALPQQINDKTLNYEYIGDLSFYNNSLFIPVIKTLSPSVEKSTVLCYSTLTGEKKIINNSNDFETEIIQDPTIPLNQLHSVIRNNNLYLIWGNNISRYNLNSQTLSVTNNFNKILEINFNNPFKNELILNSKESIKEIEISDANGRQILMAKNTSSINTSTLAKGVYFIKITTESNKVIFKKGIKN